MVAPPVIVTVPACGLPVLVPAFIALARLQVATRGFADGPQIVEWTRAYLAQVGGMQTHDEMVANAKKICFTGRDGRIEAGMPVVAAVVIEAEGEPKKILRITLPLGMALQPGTRVVIDEGQPITAPYLFCIPNGCLADYEASQDLIEHMKKGKGLALQGVNGNGQFITVTLPLIDFAKAHDGPPMGEKEFEELQKRLQQPRTSGSPWRGKLRPGRDSPR